jgi:hypothetical protein
MRRSLRVLLVCLAALVLAGCSKDSNHAATATTVPVTAAPTTTATVATTTTAAPTNTTAALPILTMGNFSGREPQGIYLSGDAGNIVTGLTWTWGATQAVGHGTRNELSCDPDCATGKATPYPATITLSKPVSGKFTLLVEVTNDGQGTTDTFNAPFTGLTACAHANATQCTS